MQKLTLFTLILTDERVLTVADAETRDFIACQFRILTSPSFEIMLLMVGIQFQMHLLLVYRMHRNCDVLSVASYKKTTT